jgi:hypothetical protein
VKTIRENYKKRIDVSGNIQDGLTMVVHHHGAGEMCCQRGAESLLEVWNMKERSERSYHILMVSGQRQSQRTHKRFWTWF